MKLILTALTRSILILTVSCVFVGCTIAVKNGYKSKSGDVISPAAFVNPPLEARPGALWCWLNGYVDHEQMTREMEEAKALGMRGFEIWDIGVLRGKELVPQGPAFLGEESLKSIKQAVAAGEARMLSVHAVESNPQWISTDRHVLQGYVDLVKKPQWNASKKTLSGTSSVIGGQPYRITLALNGYTASKKSLLKVQRRPSKFDTIIKIWQILS